MRLSPSVVRKTCLLDDVRLIERVMLTPLTEVVVQIARDFFVMYKVREVFQHVG